jgi:isopentenyldiphosphate isomerase
MEKEPPFSPREGQVDYTNIRWVPVMNCILRHDDEILLLKRSSIMRLYPNYWNGVSGFLDDDKDLVEKIFEEVSEEVGLLPENIISIMPGPIFDQDEPSYKKTWVVHPVLVEVDTKEITTDWESQDYKWVTLEKAFKLDLMHGLKQMIKSLFE